MKSVQSIFVFLLLVAGNCFSQREGLGICGETKQEKFMFNGKDTIYTEPDSYPGFPGGRKSMYKYLQENLKYPESGGCYEGKSYFRFIVNTDGSISNVKILRGMNGCPECDEEGIRVLKMMPKWIPGKVNGQPVKSYFDIPINFTIN